MSKIKIILILGIWIAVLPFLGFPYSFKNILFTITGIALIYLSYITYKKERSDESKNENFENFSENKDFLNKT